MTKQVRRLGRGLNSLLSSTLSTPTVEQVEHEARHHESLKVDHSNAGTTDRSEAHQLPPSRSPGEVGLAPFGAEGGKFVEVRLIPCLAIAPNPYQPRLDPEKANLEELADSIRQVGVLSPLTVRARGQGRFELIAGERRWRASQLAGLTEVPAIVRDVGDERMLEEALIENIQREDLHPIDRALAYRQYCESFGLTIEQVAERVGEKRQTVSNFLRLLELEPEIRELINRGVLSAGHGKALAGVGDGGLRLGLAKTVVSRSLSVRGLEELIRAQRRSPGAGRGDEAGGGRGGQTAAERRAQKRAVVADMEERFSQALGTSVEILEGQPKGSGKVVIEYYTLDDFDRIAGRLGVNLADEE